MGTLANLFIIVFTVVNILAALWLLWYTSKKRQGDDDLGADAKHTTGHVWDEDLKEYNNPLPRWWLNLFYLTVAFSAVYLIVFPGMGDFTGTLNWSSKTEHDREASRIRERQLAAYAPFQGKDVAALAADEAATLMGQKVFLAHCATCHGSDARGSRGFPNLLDGEWLYGDEPAAIVASVRDGRVGNMPAWGAVLGADGVRDVVAYVQQLSGQPHDAKAAARGQSHYQNLCVACHGPTGAGNPALGAPNLTDAHWLYGGDVDSLTQSIAQGRNGVMPAHKDKLDPEQILLVAAWIHAESRRTAEFGAASGE